MLHKIIAVELKIIVIIEHTMEEEQAMKKTERIIIELNKNGLAYLTKEQRNEAHDYFKKAEKTIEEELRVSAQNVKMNQLAAITYNNLAIYYKKCAKPKVALSYLKKALRIEISKVQNWVATASTHLNICAIYSFMNRHQQSADHAALAVTMLAKVDESTLKESNSDKGTSLASYLNVKMLSHYNLAIEYEHLHNYSDSKKQYLEAKSVAEKNREKSGGNQGEKKGEKSRGNQGEKKGEKSRGNQGEKSRGNQGEKNQNIIRSIEDAVKRVEEENQLAHKKLVDLLARRKELEEKGNHESMRKNKKNFGGEQTEWRALLQNRKYEIYKNDFESNRRNYQSTEKVRRLKPLTTDVSKPQLQP